MTCTVTKLGNGSHNGAPDSAKTVRFYLKHYLFVTDKVLIVLPEY